MEAATWVALRRVTLALFRAYSLGGLHSANTREMARLSKEQGCPTYHIETWDQFDTSMVEGREVAGVTAGASTPEDVIDEFVRHLRAL